jgi:cell division septum initiation protein DivIVA
MTVKELIEKLKEFDENLPVYCMSDQDYVRVYIDEVDEVYVTEYEEISELTESLKILEMDC